MLPHSLIERLSGTRYATVAEGVVPLLGDVEYVFALRINRLELVGVAGSGVPRVH